LLDTLDKIVKIAAILLGGVWAYYRFIRGRVYRPRLETTIKAKAFYRERKFIIVQLSIKNIGLSRVPINHDASGLRVFSSDIDRPTEPTNEPSWARIATFGVFEKHKWIESAETIQDEIMCIVPPNHIALKLEFRLCAMKLEWNTRTIVALA